MNRWLILQLNTKQLHSSVFPMRYLSSGKLFSLKESFHLLQLPHDASTSPSDVKEAYLRLAKLYHPDSGAPTADPAIFSRIEEAYRAVLEHLARQKSSSASHEEEDEKVKAQAPQHRQYLSFEGVGSGTPSQRERQYRQFRVDRATDQVLEYRREKMEKAAADEGAMVVRDARLRSKQIKITQAVERLVEDLIQESMARGDFQNLSGTGKPLNKFDYNPYMDPMTHNLNRILMDNGYQPEWIVVQKDIRDRIGKMRERMLKIRARLGEPMRPSESLQWQEHCAAFADELVKLNKKVDDFNLIVPLLSRQMVHYSLQREVEKVVKADQTLRQKQRENQRMKETETTENTEHRLITWMRNLLK